MPFYSLNTIFLVLDFYQKIQEPNFQNQILYQFIKLSLQDLEITHYKNQCQDLITAILHVMLICKEAIQ